MISQKLNQRVNPKLLGTMIKVLGLTEDGVNKKIKKLQKDRGYDISRPDAALLLASINRIDITQFTDSEKLKEIRSLKDSDYVITTPKTKTKEKDRVIKLKDITIKSKDPFITKQIISNSREMSEYYAILYILENSLRNLIREVYKSENDYWNRKIPPEIRNKVQEIKSKEKYYEEGREDELEYSHLDFLKIIIIHNWSDFVPYLKEKDKSKFIAEMDRLNPCRNAVAHTVSILKGLDAKRFQYRAEEILKML